MVLKNLLHNNNIGFIYAFTKKKKKEEDIHIYIYRLHLCSRILFFGGESKLCHNQLAWLPKQVYEGRNKLVVNGIDPQQA